MCRRSPVAAETPQLAGLIGVPVGSRVLVQIPADAASGSPSSAIVLDLLFQ